MAAFAFFQGLFRRWEGLCGLRLALQGFFLSLDLYSMLLAPHRPLTIHYKLKWPPSHFFKDYFIGGRVCVGLGLGYKVILFYSFFAMIFYSHLHLMVW